MAKKLVWVLLGVVFFLKFAAVAFAVDPQADPDINAIDLRGYSQTSGSKTTFDFNHPIDNRAPQMNNLIGGGNSQPTITNLYRVNDPIFNADTPVTMVGLKTTAGQTINVPNSGYDIGGGYQVTVLYATANQIVIHYAADDNVANGYMLHLKGFNVSKDILTKYEALRGTGGSSLLRLSGNYVLGLANGQELLLVIRDTGGFMDPRWKEWWRGKTSGSDLPPITGEIMERARPGTKTGKAEDYPEESKQRCEYGTGGASGNVPKYKKADGSVVDAERTDAGLNFATTVPGIQCAQVKSDSIALTEVAPYDLLSEPTCETMHEWMGTLDIKNVVTPFAKTIADHWAGTLDAEHIREEEIDKMDDQQRLKLSGVLGKLLTQEQKDNLRADFIDYVKKQGTKSMYANMTIYGTKITDIKRPEKASDDRKAWDKIPFFPNEQVSGQIKFNVCGDQQYRTYPAYQELMRLGLAGNQLFKLLQPEEIQKKYFSANPDLKEPYKYLTNSNIQNPTPIANDQSTKQETVFEKVKNFLAEIFGKAKEVLAQNGKCFHLEVSVDADNNAVVCLVSDSGKDGDIQFDINGVSQGQFAFNYKFHGGKYCWNPIKIPAGGAVNFHAKLDNCGDLGNEESCAVSADASGKVSTTCKPGPPPPPPPPPACDPKVSCCPTKDGCDPTCNICKLARYGPPFTVDGDPNAEEMNKKTLTIGEVNFSWDKTKDVEGWKKTPRTRPAGCIVGPWVKDAKGNKTQCVNDDGCSLDEGCRGGFCGVLECEKDHDRTVNVYNNVPYLYSLWDQVAGGSFGFLNLLKPSEKFIKAVKETPLPEGCSTDEGVVFDKFGNFSPAPAAAKVKYDFKGVPIKGIESVTMTSSPEKNLMFYRLGGVCNANKWFSEKVLAPATVGN
ncbi:MAG: hypothetical protein AAB506_02160 [Patescibacteria group bacterium]